MAGKIIFRNPLASFKVDWADLWIRIVFFVYYKAWGVFFPFQNKIWVNPQELFTKLTEISGIEFKKLLK